MEPGRGLGALSSGAGKPAPPGGVPHPDLERPDHEEDADRQSGVHRFRRARARLRGRGVAAKLALNPAIHSSPPSGARHGDRDVEEGDVREALRPEPAVYLGKRVHRLVPGRIPVEGVQDPPLRVGMLADGEDGP